jgi:hypothetical protein
MPRRPSLPLVAAGLAAAAAVFVLGRVVLGRDPADGVYFYDVSAARLFVAPRGSVPPIRGIDGPEEDAFRAVVVADSGDPADRNSRRIVYLERYSPELKRQTERSQTGAESPSIGRAEAGAHRWVRRTNDTEWVPLGSDAGERIVSGWAVPGPGGVTPAVCTP